MPFPGPGEKRQVSTAAELRATGLESDHPLQQPPEASSTPWTWRYGATRCGSRRPGQFRRKIPPRGPFDVTRDGKRLLIAVPAEVRPPSAPRRGQAPRWRWELAARARREVTPSAHGTLLRNSSLPRPDSAKKPLTLVRRNAARPLRDPLAARGGRHGGGLPGARRQAQARRRDQGAARRGRGRCGAARAIRARGAGARGAESSAHRGDLRPREVGRHRGADPRARRGRDAGGADRGRARFRSTRPSRSRARSRTRSRQRTRGGSSIATSSRPT